MGSNELYNRQHCRIRNFHHPNLDLAQRFLCILFPSELSSFRLIDWCLLDYLGSIGSHFRFGRILVSQDCNNLFIFLVMLNLELLSGNLAAILPIFVMLNGTKILGKITGIQLFNPFQAFDCICFYVHRMHTYISCNFHQIFGF